MAKTKNALEKIFGHTPTPVVITAIYQAKISKLRKLRADTSNVFLERDTKELVKEIDELLKASTEVYG